MREVLQEGRTQHRVSVREAMGRPSTCGLGAAANLRGEIAILDNVAWVTSVSAEGILETRTADDGDIGATLLITGEVPKWREILWDKAVPGADLDSRVEEAAARVGVNLSNPFLFRIDATAEALKAHVIHGACPHEGAAGPSGAGPRSVSVSVDRPTPVILIGVFARNSAGVLTHHDSRTHVHVLLLDDRPIVAHVDSVSLRAGAVVRLPSGR